eukprot:13372914-Alexandrium_andersonii.AAC.1
MQQQPSSYHYQQVHVHHAVISSPTAAEKRDKSTRACITQQPAIRLLNAEPCGTCTRGITALWPPTAS